jgi:uncharacterized NAD-dependent epimerase/dehydratase family protein
MKKARALVYCEDNFLNANGKTAHGLVRYTKRYDIAGVVDSKMPKGDAGELLDGKFRDIPLFQDLNNAISETEPEIFIIGAVSEGGGLPSGYRKAVARALKSGLDVVCGLHEFLSDDPEFTQLARKNRCNITDVRKIFRDQKRFYTGEINKVGATRIAMLGTDSAIGKRTTAVMLVKEFLHRKKKADMIYTGQTGWLQGWPHGILMDAMINDFVSGGIEGAIIDSWKYSNPNYMIIEGQGSLVHPFFPGGFEIMAAGQIHGFVLQDAPKRPHLDGFSGYPMPDPKRVIDIAKLISQCPLIGISLNKENMSSKDIKEAKYRMRKRFKVPVEEPISDGVGELADAIERLH